MAHRSFQGLLRLFCLRFFCNYPGSYESWAVLGEPMHFRTPIEHPLVINYDGISLAGAGEHRSQQFRPEHVINVPVAHPIAVIPATPVYLYTPIPAWLSPTGYFQAGTSQPYSASERPSIAPRSGVLTRHPASFPAATVLIPHQQSPGIPMHPIWQGRQQNMRPQHAIYGSRLTAASVAKPPSETLEIPGNSGDKFAPQIDPCTIAFKRSPVAPEFISSSKIVNPPEKFSPIPVKEAPTCSQRETNSEVKVSKTLSSVSSVESDFMRTPTNPKTPTLVSNDASTRTSVPKSSEPNSTAHVNQPGAPSSRGKEL